MKLRECSLVFSLFYIYLILLLFIFKKETMLAKGCTEEEIAEVMKTERRKEERVLKRTTKSFCYQCRQPGHMVSFCPENEKDGISNNYIICFKVSIGLSHILMHA